MFTIKAFAATALVAALAAPAWATNVALTTSAAGAGYGQWNTFNVNDLDAQDFGVGWIDNADSLSAGFGSPLSFSFTIATGTIGTFTVIDAAVAGDTFLVTNSGNLLGATSSVPVASYDDNIPGVGLDFSAALADTSFSRGVFQLGAGNYNITGVLAQSVLFDGTPLNATVGAVSLTVSAVPEPSSMALMLAGAGLMGTMVRRKRR